MFKPLSLTEQAILRIDTLVRAADSRECLGLLASIPGVDYVTGIEVLPARASSVSAEAAPIAVKHAADALSSRGLIPRGIWHSHGHLDVFHSGTDIATIHRLLPTMAAANYERGVTVNAPVVEGPDTAVLPLKDGRTLTCTLGGDAISGTDLFQPAAWTRVSIDYERVTGEPAARLDASHLRLSAAGVSVTLGIPPGARVQTQVVDRAFARIAWLYSLVVNTRRERYAQCLSVVQIAGESFTQLADCEVVTVTDGRVDDRAADVQASDACLVGIPALG